ncbi:MAG: TVP38/TMEM64 family protein [Pseudomonadota bacterium]|nr:MAG: TVP38/TMEM64 family protein [Pseudomonadota bacterium]
MTTRDTKPDRGTHPGRWRLLVLLALVGIGLAAEWFGWVDWRTLLELSRRHSHEPWLPLVLIAGQAALFTFALPGSLVIWPLAALYSPSAATALFLCGGSLGALGAYQFSSRLSRQWRVHVQEHRVYRTLARRSNFMAMAALRLLPGFPHSVINYSAGLLALPRGAFLAAAVLGMSIKFYLYARAIHHATAAHSLAELLRAETLVPLVLFSALFAAGQLVRER